MQSEICASVILRRVYDESITIFSMVKIVNPSSRQSHVAAQRSCVAVEQTIQATES